jgi:hypothetical protein
MTSLVLPSIMSMSAGELPAVFDSVKARLVKFAVPKLASGA